MEAEAVPQGDAAGPEPWDVARLQACFLLAPVWWQEKGRQTIGWEVRCTGWWPWRGEGVARLSWATSRLRSILAARLQVVTQNSGCRIGTEWALDHPGPLPCCGVEPVHLTLYLQKYSGRSAVE